MLRRIMPKGLYARTLLIVVLPIFLMQTVVTYVFFDRHWDSVTANLTSSAAGDIALVTRLYSGSDGEIPWTDLQRLAMNELDLSVRFEKGGVIPQKDKLSIFSSINRKLNRLLAEKLDRDFWFNTSGYPDYIEVRVQMSDGYLNFLARRDRVIATNGHIFVMWLIGATVLLGWIATVFMRNQVRAILKLARAAEAFGRGRDAPEYRPTGASEVRQAGRAFIAMRERIKRYVDQRTSMLAGVSHDLRTPLTRMKLALAMRADDPDLAAMKADVDEMENMLEAYLAFARNQAAEEPEPADVRLLLDEVESETARGGARISVEADGELTIPVRKNAVKRAITNLVSNALTHGTTVSIHASRIDGHVKISIDDDGPGIDPADYESAFRPFQRLDDARNQNAAGVGLGLAVVRDIARAHGGDVTLARAPSGGLRATLRLPA